MLHARLRAASGGAFSPEQLSALRAWYDPSDLSTLWQDEAGTTPVTADGDPVRLVQDKSDSGLDLTPTGASAYFTYRTSGGLHWLELGGSQHMEAVGSKTTMAFAHFTGYSGCYGARFGAASDPNTAYILLSNGGGTHDKRGISFWYDDRSTSSRNDTLVHLTGAASGTSVINPVAPNGTCPAQTDVVLSEITDPGNATASERHRMRVNRGTDIQDNTFTEPASSGDATDDLVVGALSASLALPMVGRIYQIVLAEGQLDSVDRTNLEDWVAEKTGVTL